MSAADATPEQATQYRVTAEYVLVTTANGIGSLVTGKPAQTAYRRDMILPGDVPEEQLRHLLDSGMVEDLGPAPAAAEG